MGIDSLFHVIRARWKQIALIAMLVTAASVVLTALMPRQYRAQASFVVDNRAAEIAGMPMAQTMLPATYMATQVDIVRSSRVARKVLDALDAQSLATLHALHEASHSSEPFETWAVPMLQAGLVVAHSRESNVVGVSYSARNPELAARVANAFVDAYVGTAVELRAQPAQRYSEFFESEAAAARDRLRKAQERLSAFRKSTGIAVTDERLDAENNRLTDLNKEMVLIQSKAAEASSRAQQARRSPERLAEVMNDPVLVGMRNDLQRARTTLSEEQQRLGPSHPRIVEARAAVRELTTRIREETDRLAQSVEATSATGSDRIAALQKAIDQQRQVVAGMQNARTDAALLVNDVDAAQTAYNAIIRGGNQTRLESRSTQGSASILEMASPPSAPTSPRPMLNLFIGVFAGTLLGILYALWREATTGRVRSEAQLLELAGPMLLTTVPKFRHSARLTFDPRRSLGRPQRRLPAR